MLVLALKAIQSLKIAHRIQALVENLSLPGVFCFYQLEGTEGSWKWKHCGILKNRKKLEMAGLAREKGEIEDGLSCVSSEPEGSL